MEKFNYHKLVNLRKRFNRFDDEVSNEIRAVIDKHLLIQREISRAKDKTRREEYHSKQISCKLCGNTMRRDSVYVHFRDVCAIPEGHDPQEFIDLNV
jgi:5-methylcytosine-specific restriction endonuclease McrA